MNNNNEDFETLDSVEAVEENNPVKEIKTFDTTNTDNKVDSVQSINTEKIKKKKGIKKELIIGIILFIISICALLYGVSLDKVNSKLSGSVTQEQNDGIEANQYSFHLMAPEASVNQLQEFIFTYEEGPPKKVAIPTRPGYIFLGFFGYGDKQYYDSNGNYVLKEDLGEPHGDWLGAKYEKDESVKSYLVKFDSQCGLDQESTVVKGGTMPTLRWIPKKLGYTFEGYFYNNKMYYNAEGNPVRKFEEDRDITLVAKHTKNGNSISKFWLDKEGSYSSYDKNHNPIYSVYEVEYGTFMPEIFQGHEIYVNSEGLQFKGYYYKGVQYYDERYNPVRKCDFSGTVVLESKWEKPSNKGGNSSNSSSNKEEKKSTTYSSEWFSELSSNGVTVIISNTIYRAGTTKLNFNSVKDNSVEKLFTNVKAIQVYDFSIVNGKTPLKSLNGNAKVILPIPSNIDASSTYVYMIVNGTKEKLYSKVDGKNITFSTSNFGKIAIVNYSNNEAAAKEKITVNTTSTNGKTFGSLALPGDIDLSDAVVNMNDVTEKKENKEIVSDFSEMDNIKIVETTITGKDGKELNLGNDSVDQSVNIPNGWDTDVLEVYIPNEMSTRVGASVTETKKQSKYIKLNYKVENNLVKFSNVGLSKVILVQNNKLANKKTTENKVVKNNKKDNKSKPLIIGGSIIGLIVSILLIIKGLKKKKM